MSTIKVSVVDQVLTIADSPLIASGDVNVDHVQFTFDDSWRGFGLAAVFYREGETQVYRSVIPRNGLAVIPHEVMVSRGRICFGVAGVAGSDVKTTEIAYYDIHEGAVNAGAETQPPTPGIYEQMLSSVGDLQDYFDATVDAIERSAGRVVLFSGLASSLPVVETAAGSLRRLIFPNSKTITDFDRITLQFSNLGLYGLSSGTGTLNIHNGAISIAELTAGVDGGYALVELAGLSGTPGDNAYRVTVSNWYQSGGTGARQDTSTLQKGASGYLTGISYLDLKITSNTYVNVIGYNNELIAIPDEPDEGEEEDVTETLYVHMTSSSHADMTSVEIFNALLTAQQAEQDLHVILEDHTGRECLICYKPGSDSESARFFTLDYSTNTLIVYTVNTSGSVSVSSGIYCHGMGFGYGECSTAAATAAKTATINNFRLGASGIVIIKFANAVPASATLNISSTGAKPIYYAGAAITAGVINAGATVTMVYADSTYIVLSIDDRYRKPDTGIPEADLSEAVQEKLNATGLTKFITVTYYDGEYYASAGPAQIFQDLDDGNVQYVLIDRYGRQCTLVEPPELPTGSTAKFAGIDAEGDTIYIHTISTVNTLNLVSTDSVPISGSSSSATWNDIKPSSGVPKTDLESSVQTSLDKANTALQPDDGAIILAMKQTGSVVTLNKSPTQLMALCSSQQIVYFSLGTTTFTPTSVDAANGIVNLASAVNGIGYEVTLAPTSSTTMGGLLISYPLKVFEINFSIVSNTPTCDKTYAEIVAAKNAGKILRPIFNDFEGIVSHVDSNEAQFWFIDDTGGTPIWEVFWIDNTDSVSSSSSDMGNAMQPTVSTNSTASPPNLSAQANTVYKYTAAALTSLTVTSIPANGDCSIEFNSGSTATILTMPASVHMPDDFTAPEANKHYEINIHDGYAVVASWAVSA